MFHILVIILFAILGVITIYGLMKSNASAERLARAHRRPEAQPVRDERPTSPEMTSQQQMPAESGRHGG